MKPKLREAYEETLQVLLGVDDIMLHCHNSQPRLFKPFLKPSGTRRNLLENDRIFWNMMEPGGI